MTRNPEISPRESRMTAFAAATSFIGEVVRPVGSMLVGGDPRVRRVTYRQVMTPHNARWAWMMYTGDPRAPRLPAPRLYKTVALTTFSGLELDAIRESEPDENGQLPVAAVGWKFELNDTLALAAELTEDDVDYLAVQGVYGMRRGRGPLITAIGSLWPQSGRFQPFGTSLMEPGDTIPLSEAPDDLYVY